MAEQRLQRRLAAILSADVVGYSRLLGTDEAGTLARLKALRRDVIDPNIAGHSGRIVKLMGDGVLVEFGSAVDAVACAIEIQKHVPKHEAAGAGADSIRFRVGINVGDIIIDGDDILGDGVNIAARIEGVAAPGGISLSEDAWRQVQSKVAAKFFDDGEHSLKNIAGPVRVYRVELGGEGTAQPAAPAPVPPDKPSIAVLPFANMSGDPEQEFFANGIAEDIITALSRYSSLFVIARNSSFSFKGRAVDVKQVGRELGVRYVLEGSLRKSGNRIRVTAQLVEAETGNHVWAERYDRDLADFFTVQDEITQATTIAIAPAIADAEQQRAMRKPPASLDAWGTYQRGMWHLSKASAEDNALAEKFFQRATELDPMFVGGYIGLAAFSAGQKGHKVTKKRWQGAQSRSMAATQRRIPAWLLHSSHAATTRAHVLKPSGRW